MKELKEHFADFISRLKKLFGSFDEGNNKFSKASNSEISRELGYSDAQFSRLINQHATEGEYVRAIQNADRIIELQKLRQQEVKGKHTSRFSGYIWIIHVGCGILLGILGLMLLSKNEQPIDSKRYDMLEWSFETSYINPFVKLKDLPLDCSYPCYKYQGKWTLDQPYKLPVFRERNGFHYLANEVVMYNRCMAEKSNSGDTMEGLEYQYHEIWYDKRELPIDSFLVKNGKFQLRKEYEESDFSQQADFVQLARIHTFFRNEFRLDSVQIHRTGKVIGRDIEFVDATILKKRLGSKEKVDEIMQEVNVVIINRLQDFSRPISCSTAGLPQSDFHLIAKDDKMSFDCQMTTDRVSLEYKKTYLLEDQYITNKCQPSAVKLIQ